MPRWAVNWRTLKWWWPSRARRMPPPRASCRHHPPGGGARAPGGPPGLRAGRGHAVVPGRAAAVPCDVAQGGVGGRHRACRGGGGRRLHCFRPHESMPLHALIESPRRRAAGLCHCGAPARAVAELRLDGFRLRPWRRHSGPGHGRAGAVQPPLVLRAKLEISSACHAHGKVPAHSVVTEFSDAQAMQTAAGRAANELGYTRMWSIHPSQIRPILVAMAPSPEAVERAADLVLAAQQADWAPISYEGRLHDRASYRYFLAAAGARPPDRRQAAGHGAGLFCGPGSLIQKKRERHAHEETHTGPAGDLHGGCSAWAQTASTRQGQGRHQEERQGRAQEQGGCAQQGRADGRRHRSRRGRADA